MLELFDCARALLERGYDVIAAGLDLNFRGQPFGDMLALGWLVNAYGGNVTWCIAYCECGARAFFSQRLINGEPASYESPTLWPVIPIGRAARSTLFCPGGPGGPICQLTTNPRSPDLPAVL